MGRRGLLFVILGLVACAGDQPTEPTWEGAAGGFLAGPPPPPAPPTELTGELGGGTGLGVSTELGFWESPVYATVTVDGALGYSGRPDGYLPGTGQIDAAGILVQNQCDLTVYISFATSSGGATLPIAPTCWYPARNMGSYTRRMTLQGRVWTYRTAGPPLSCYKGGTPCVSYEGEQSVTVTPEEGKIILTPNKTLVAPGGGITINAKGVWSNDGITGVPFSVREWRWQGSGAEVGGGHTKVCAVYNTNQCIVQVYQSGNVVLEGLVNGKVKTENVWIRVIGGDSLPPPPPDSLPPNDSLPPTDTLPGGGGCSTSAGQSLHFAACDTTSPAKATLGCNPNNVVRGDSATCTLGVQGGDSARILTWTATRNGSSVAWPQAPSIVTGPIQWAGRFVSATRLEAVVEVFSGTRADTLAVIDSVTVMARNWQALITSAPTVINAAPSRFGMTLEPNVSGGTWHFRLGVNVIHNFDFWDASTALVGAIQSGPNSGLWFVASLPAIMVDTIYLNPQLLRRPCGQWCREQNGADPTLIPRECTQNDLPALRAAAGAHEGVGSTTNSHWGNMSASYGNPRVQSALEGAVSELGDADLRFTGDSIVRTEIAEPRRLADVTLDALYFMVWQTAGCKPDIVLDGN